MKKIETFFNGLTKWHGFALLLYGIAVLLMSKFNILEKSITIKYWELILLILLPHILFFTLRLIWLRQKRTYKMGDFVSIIADERKFMVVRYLTWQPLHAVCKQVNSADALALHEKYLVNWVDIIDSSYGLNAILGNRNINTVIPTAIITRL